MSEAQAPVQINPPSQPKLMALPQPSAEELMGELIDKRLQLMGVPQGISADMTKAVEDAAKKVPVWVLWLILSFGPTLGFGIYSQYQTYKDIPARMVTLETAQKTQGDQLNRIEDLLSPTSRPK